MKLPNGYGSITKLSGKRRNPYAVKVTVGWELDADTGKQKQVTQYIGYASTKVEALQILSNYHANPYNLKTTKLTFEDIYNKWSKEKFPYISKSNVKGYQASFSACTPLKNIPFKDIKLDDLQQVIDNCGKNYPTLKKISVLFHQLYDYAMKHDITTKDYSQYVNIIKHKSKNPNKKDRDKFTKKEIDILWSVSDDKYYQIILMLIYTGVRISELLNLKKENVNLEEQYFDVIESKTENGIRKVPIADKILPFFTSWYNDTQNNEYLLFTSDGEHFEYRNYYDSYFKPLMSNLNFSHTPHFCRHTCISMLAEAGVSQTIIKKIVGHSGAMTLTEKVYTHLDTKELLDAINMI